MDNIWFQQDDYKFPEMKKSTKRAFKELWFQAIGLFFFGCGEGWMFYNNPETMLIQAEFYDAIAAIDP